MRFLRWQMAALVGIAFYMSGCTGNAPSREIVTTALTKVLPVSFVIQEITPLQNIRGLCQVVIKANNKPMVFYMDKEGNYLFSGSVIEVATKKNLTLDAEKRYISVKESSKDTND